VLAQQHVVLAGIAKEEPGGRSPSIDNEVGLEGLMEDIGRLVVVASDLDVLREPVDGWIEPILDGFVEFGVDESFAICS
jgi:hypothetical protein